jgi:hypothetical protein
MTINTSNQNRKVMPAPTAPQASICMHARFAEKVMGVELPTATRNYLNTKEENFHEYLKYGFNYNESALGVQIAHVVLLPFKVLGFVFQVTADIALYTAAALGDLLTLGQMEVLTNERKARAYNLFADAMILGSIPISIFWSSGYKGAQSLHLGTFRVIYFS